MARTPERLINRNKKIEERYTYLSKKNPHYRNEYVVGLVAEEFFLSARTIYAVLSGEYVRRWQTKQATPQETHCCP
jgi:hypothetical protein